MAPDGDVLCYCDRGYTGRRCEKCEQDFHGNPLLPGGSCKPLSNNECDERGTHRIRSDGSCECKENVIGSHCNQCDHGSFFLEAENQNGCTKCFCSGVSQTCTSSSLYKNSIRATFSPNRNDFGLVTDFESPQESPISINVDGNEASFRGNFDEPNRYYWRLPSMFAGNLITSYGGHLNYTVRFVPYPSGHMSRNNAPDVVIRTRQNGILLHYRRTEVTPNEPLSCQVLIGEGQWRAVDGNTVSREEILSALSDVSAILIKATYTTTTYEAALSEVSLSIPSQHHSYENYALSVEQCICPAGHQGTSCESCSLGYTRNGQMTGFCEPCNCNGHSNECDPISGICDVSTQGCPRNRW